MKTIAQFIINNKFQLGYVFFEQYFVFQQKQ